MLLMFHQTLHQMLHQMFHQIVDILWLRNQNEVRYRTFQLRSRSPADRGRHAGRGHAQPGRAGHRGRRERGAERVGIQDTNE